MLHGPATDHGADTLLAGGVTVREAQNGNNPWVGGRGIPPALRSVSLPMGFPLGTLRPS